MEYIYAAMLLHKAGKEINEQNVSQVLTAAGVNVDAIKAKALVASLAEVKIDEAIKSASTMMAAPTAGGAPTGAAGAQTEAKPKEEDKKKKEADEKQKEEQALEGLGALFG